MTLRKGATVDVRFNVSPGPRVMRRSAKVLAVHDDGRLDLEFEYLNAKGDEKTVELRNVPNDERRRAVPSWAEPIPDEPTKKSPAKTGGKKSPAKTGGKSDETGGKSDETGDGAGK